MKKKNLQLKLNLKKQTILDLSAQNSIHGGKPIAPPATTDCQRTVLNCETQGTAFPCCPGCRSGYNATIARDLCDTVVATLQETICVMEP